MKSFETHTHRPIWHKVWQLAVPSSAVFFLVGVGNVAMIKIVAGLGGDAVAGVITGTRLYNIFTAIMMGLSASTLALVTRAWGEGNPQEANNLLSTSLLISLLMGVVMTVLTVLFAPIFVSIFELPTEAHLASVTFLRYFSFFYTPIAAYMILAAALRAAGDTRTPMYIAALINVLIIPFSYWLTYGGLGLPSIGIGGTAIGAGLGNLVGVLFVFYYWHSGRLRLLPTWVTSKQRRRLFTKLWQLGYPAALEQGVMQVGFLAFLWVVAKYGMPAYAAYGAGITLLALSIVIGFGFSIASSILVGQRLGAGDIPGAKAAGWSAMRQAVAVLTVLSVLLANFAHPLSAWLVEDPEVVHYTVMFIYVFCAVQPLLGIDMALGGALRGAGDTLFPFYASIGGIIFVRFGLAWLFMSMGLSVVWVYCAMLGDYLLKSLLYIWRFHSGRWATKLN